MHKKNDIPVINLKEIGNRIKEYRIKKNIKVTEISNQMGFETPQAVYKWQRGECLQDIQNLIILSRMLGTTVEGIILGDEGCPLPIFTDKFKLLVDVIVGRFLILSLYK